MRKGELTALPEITRTEDPYAVLQHQDKDAVKNSQLSTKSMLGDLLSDPRSRSILEREVPALVNSPQIAMGSQMSLRALQPFAPEMLTDKVLETIDQELTKLPANK
jgi:hypothetical protein